MKDKNVLRLIFNALLMKGKVENQADFGEKLGWKEAYTSKLLNGKQDFPKNLGKKLADIFGENLERWEKSYESFDQDTMENIMDDVIQINKYFDNRLPAADEPTSDDTSEVIALLKQLAEAERIARVEAQEAKLAEREAKEAYREIVRMQKEKEANAPALAARLLDFDAKLDAQQVWLSENLAGLLKKGPGKLFEEIVQATEIRQKAYAQGMFGKADS